MSTVERLGLTIPGREAEAATPPAEANGRNGRRLSLQWLTDLWRRRNGKATPDPATYSRLALQLHFDLPREGGNRSVLVVTPQRSSMGAQASAWLARSLGEQLHEPILLADTARECTLSTLLECDSVSGISDFLYSRSPQIDPLKLPTSSEHVSFIPAGRNASGALLPTDRIAQFVAAGRVASNFLVISGGPVLNDAVSLAIAPHVGCVLLLAVENESRIDEVREAEQVLGRCHASRVGLVFSRRLP